MLIKKTIKITGNMKFLLFSIISAIIMMGMSYSFFVYYNEGTSEKLRAGQILLVFNELNGSIKLTDTYPQTKEEARNRTDNVITFTVGGNNTTNNKDIYYEITLNEGSEIAGKTRFRPSDLVFDLIEVDKDGNETLVVDAMSYDNFYEQRIWVNTINHDTENVITRTYKLRIWLSENVIISDTEPNASYTADVFANSYANVKVAVFGDFNEKEIPVYSSNK